MRLCTDSTKEILWVGSQWKELTISVQQMSVGLQTVTVVMGYGWVGREGHGQESYMKSG